MSHHYRDRLARIPLPPPPPPPPPPELVPEPTLLLRPQSPASDVREISPPDFAQSEGLTFVGGEESTPDFPEPAPTTTKRKGKGKDAASKRVPAAGSESESDGPLSRRPPHKKRRVDKDEAADDDVRSLLGESASAVGASPANKLLSNAKGRGKGKQREQSTDSVSAAATPKGRKKPGPRKKLDNLPPATQESLGVGSAAPSVSGDVTPSASRPPSPTLTSISAKVYELDEAIPPLKRARKVDDHAMAKRVRNLEEAQRKVWMNIARRDIAKVRVRSGAYMNIFKCLAHRCTGTTRRATRSARLR